jgi:hypothetical protein
VRVVRGEVSTLNTELRDQTTKFNAELRQSTEPIESGLRQLTEFPQAEPASVVPSEVALVLASGVSINEDGAAPPTDAAEPAAEPSSAGNAEPSGQPPLVF